MQRGAAWIVTSLLFLSSPRLVHAQTTSEADRAARRELLTQANEARTRGQFERALSLVLQAEVFGITAGMRLLAGQLYAQLGRYGEARTSADRCLVEVERDTQTTEANRAAIRSACTSLRQDAEAHLPAPTPAAPTPTPTTVATPVVAATAPTAAPVAPSTITPPRPLAPAPGSLQRTVAWAAVGTGAAFVVAGLVTSAVFSGQRDEYNARNCADLAPTADCQTRFSEMETLHAAQWGLYITGGIVAAAGVVLRVTAPSGGSTERALSCGSGPGSLGVQCALRF